MSKAKTKVIEGDRTAEALLPEIEMYRAGAASLEPDAAKRHQLLQAVEDYTEKMLANLDGRPAYTSGVTGAGLLDSPIAESGMPVEEVLELFRKNVDEPGLAPISDRFLAYIPPGANYYSALGDFLAAVTNKFSGEAASSPGAVRMEHQLLRWMCDLVGYPDSAMGNLTSGGSMGILSAVVTAREAFNLKARHFHEAVVYATAHTHHSLKKALHIAGMGECVVREVQRDDRYRMDAADLDRCITADRNRGLKPWLVAGSSGTTDLGSIDPLAALADVAARQELWFHVDGAYGGLFVISDLVRDSFNGIERSDSLVMNPHKPLQIPFGVGAILVREGELLFKAHFHTASYLQDNLLQRDLVSPANLGPELTRHFRALRIWLPLKLIGVAPFRAALNEKILLTRYAYARMREWEEFELSPPPDLTVFAFRYVPRRGDADAFNRELLLALRDDGTILLSSTVIDGKYMIRFAVLSFRTHLHSIDLALDIIRDKAKELESR